MGNLKRGDVSNTPGARLRSQLADLIDISLPLRPGMPVWPGSIGFHLTRTMRLDAGDVANVSRLECDVHVGTHVDAPWHFLPNGRTVEQLSLDVLVGTAVVAHLPDARVVTPDVLAELGVEPRVERLLSRTRNSQLWAAEVPDFRQDYAALTTEAAHWVVDRGIRLIEVVYLSVQRYGDGSLTHQVLLEAGVIILEGLNLAHVRPGLYELLCLPLRLAGADGAPARAVLRTLSPR